MDSYKITTDETLRETVRHGDSSYPFAYYPENIWQFDFHRIDWHWHSELEFLFVENGAALCLAGESNCMKASAYLSTAVFSTVLKHGAAHSFLTLFFRQPC